jgi:hypothetical protein
LRGKIDFKAKTIAQFLRTTGRYDVDTGRYKILTPAEKHNVKGEAIAKTVIIDESSMLHEDMFGALLDAVATLDTAVGQSDYVLFEIDQLRVVTPSAVKRTALKEYRSPYSRAVLGGKLLKGADQSSNFTVYH